MWSLSGGTWQADHKLCKGPSAATTLKVSARGRAPLDRGHRRETVGAGAEKARPCPEPLAGARGSPSAVCALQTCRSPQAAPHTRPTGSISSLAPSGPGEAVASPHLPALLEACRRTPHLENSFASHVVRMHAPASLLLHPCWRRVQGSTADDRQASHGRPGGARERPRQTSHPT